MSCRSVRDWLHRDAQALDETQRLLLDDHLAACERCRTDRHHLRLLHRAGTALPVPPVGSREYNRAISRALLEGSGRRAGPSPSRSWFRPAALAALAFAGAAVAIVAYTRGVPDPPAQREAAVPRLPARASSPEQVPAPPSPSPAVADTTPAVVADVVEQGALDPVTRDGDGVQRPTRTIAPGAAVPANTLLRAVEPTRARLASLRVVIAASSELRWMPAERMVVLDRGTLTVEGEPGDPVRLVTERFSVVFADAALTVDPAAVRVARGVARVFDRARGRVARVAAGATWKPSPAHAAPGQPPAPPSSVAAPSSPAAASESAARAPSARDEAEARMFQAEVAHTSGALDLAVERYLAVATLFGDQPAGETALYAAARIELRRSRAAAARALLTRYLARYPAGRYADDARREFATLP